MSVMRPELIMKSIIPVVMAGIIAIYGLVVAVLIANNTRENQSLYKWVQLTRVFFLSRCTICHFLSFFFFKADLPVLLWTNSVFCLTNINKISCKEGFRLLWSLADGWIYPWSVWMMETCLQSVANHCLSSSSETLKSVTDSGLCHTFQLHFLCLESSECLQSSLHLPWYSAN